MGRWEVKEVRDQQLRSALEHGWEPYGVAVDQMNKTRHFLRRPQKAAAKKAQS